MCTTKGSDVRPPPSGAAWAPLLLRGRYGTMCIVSQNADEDFARACAIEMHIDMSQETAEEPLYTARLGPERGRTFCASLRSRMHVHMSQAQSEEPLYTEIHRKNAAAQNELRTQPHILCEPAQSQRMSKFHKSHFILKFTGKMPGPRLSTLIKHRP